MTQQVEAAVRVVVDGATATVTIGTGRRRNALGPVDWRELAHVFGQLAEDASLCAVVVRGTGDTFCAGSDLSAWRDAPPELIEESFALMEDAFRAVERLGVPVIAAVDGVAAGAGCQLALACDIRVMTTLARIGMPIARLGILPSPAFAARLIRLAGPAVTTELLCTGRLLQGPQAVVAGLANTATPAESLTSHVDALVADMARHPQTAILAAKRAVVAASTPAPQHSLGPAVAYPAFQQALSRFFAGNR